MNAKPIPFLSEFSLIAGVQDETGNEIYVSLGKTIRSVKPNH